MGPDPVIRRIILLGSQTSTSENISENKVAGDMKKNREVTRKMCIKKGFDVIWILCLQSQFYNFLEFLVGHQRFSSGSYATIK